MLLLPIPYYIITNNNIDRSRPSLDRVYTYSVYTLYPCIYLFNFYNTHVYIHTLSYIYTHSYTL